MQCNPAPRATLSPLLALINEHALTFGHVQPTSGDDWQFVTGLEWQVPHKVRYDNANLPFGPSTERNSALFLPLGWSRTWH